MTNFKQELDVSPYSFCPVDTVYTCQDKTDWEMVPRWYPIFGSAERGPTNRTTERTTINEHLPQEILAHRRIEEILYQRNRELALLNRVGQLFTSTLELEQVLTNVLEEMCQLLEIVAASFWILVPERGELVCQQAVGPESETIMGWQLAVGQGNVGQAAQREEIVYVKDSRTDNHHYKGIDQQTGTELRSILSIPFRAKGQVVGVLQLVDTTANRFTEEDLQLVESIAGAAASAIENAHLYMTAQQELAERNRAERELNIYRDHLEDLVQARTAEITKTNTYLRQEIAERQRIETSLHQRNRELTLLNRVGHMFTSTLELDQVLTNVLGEMRQLLEITAASFWILSPETGELVCQQAVGPGRETIMGWRLALGKGIVGQAAQTGQLISVQDSRIDPRHYKKIDHQIGIELRSIVSIPFRAKGKVIGVLNLGDTGVSRFTQQELCLVESIAASAASAVENAHLYLTTQQEIAERKRVEEQVTYLAYHDALTGLPNRKAFYRYLEDTLGQRSHRRAGDEHRADGHKWALLFLDLDKFKQVNDTLGHDMGDELLQVVAVRLQNSLRKSDRIFRLGGDEFTILLNHLTHDIDVVKVARKIQETVSQPYTLKGHTLHMTVSIGISIYPDDGDEIETLVKHADIAMYAAKDTGQGYQFFTQEMNRKALERMMLENSLHTALHKHQFVLHYQPLVDDRNRVIGMEALLRWQHPEAGLMSPTQFITVAEETGEIISIGKWVLYMACHQTKMWQAMGNTNLYVAVNLSARQFREPDLVDTVEQVLEETGLAPEYLHLEVTESSIMEDPDQAIAKMQRLRAQGIHFSIDDFGIGYSSLSYLKRFPIDTLKIDRSFVTEATTNTDDQEIIRVIIAMARNLRLALVAEGVETKAQHDFLSRQGCQIMQGYYFGRPMSTDQFEQMLRMREAACEEQNAVDVPSDR